SRNVSGPISIRSDLAPETAQRRVIGRADELVLERDLQELFEVDLRPFGFPEVGRRRRDLVCAQPQVRHDLDPGRLRERGCFEGATAPLVAASVLGQLYRPQKNRLQPVDRGKEYRGTDVAWKLGRESRLHDVGDAILFQLEQGGCEPVV